MINKYKIDVFKKIDYMFNQGAISIKRFNEVLKELNLNQDELNHINKIRRLVF